MSKPKNLVKLLLKYQDFALATIVIEQLNLQNLAIVYEEWCIQMLKLSTQTELVIIEKFREKFENLAAKVAIDQGFSSS